MNDDTLVYFGGSVKALGDGKVGGFLVLFGTPASADVQGDYFTAATDFGLDVSAKTRVVYHHGFTKALGARKLGVAHLTLQAEGVWAEAALDVADPRVREVYEAAKAGKLGWSSGSTERLVERKPVAGKHEVVSWPLIEGSLTPTPVNPSCRAVAIKALLLDAEAEVKGKHLGPLSGHFAVQAAMDSLHDSLKGRISDHMNDDRKSKAQKLRACGGCLNEHREAVLGAVKAMVPDDQVPAGGGDGDGAMKARRLRLAAMHLEDLQYGIPAMTPDERP